VPSCQSLFGAGKESGIAEPLDVVGDNVEEARGAGVVGSGGIPSGIDEEFRGTMVGVGAAGIAVLLSSIEPGPKPPSELPEEVLVYDFAGPNEEPTLLDAPEP